MSAHEQAVMATSTDALMTKVYAAGLGYFNDPYAKLFLKKTGRKMYPIINRGTWARVQSYRQTVMNFVKKYLIDQQKEVNILSLGAGYDTTHFWLQSFLAQNQLAPGKKVCYVEVDYEQVVKQKIGVIRQHKELAATMAITPGVPEEQMLGENFMNTDNYKLFEQDLKKIEELGPKLTEIYKVDLSRPTLVMTECLLVYLKPAESDKILNWIS